MMVQGEAEIDMASLDPKRFGGWMTTEYAARKNEECYDHVFILHHPDEEREACRPLRTAPVYDRQKALGAQFGQVNGWERPNYYGPQDAPADFDHHAPQLPPRRLVAICGGRGQGDPRDGRADRRHRLHQAPRARAGGDGLPRLVHHATSCPNVGRINLTYALTDHRHDAHRIHHRPAGRAGILPGLRRGLDGL